jgi:hypothetical protein
MDRLTRSARIFYFPPVFIGYNNHWNLTGWIVIVINHYEDLCRTRGRAFTATVTFVGIDRNKKFTGTVLVSMIGKHLFTTFFKQCFRE